MKQLKVQLFDYVNWWNHIRLHGTLNYQSPVSFRIAKSMRNSGVTGGILRYRFSCATPYKFCSRKCCHS
ncbi:IS3 family transposase, partial [Listeria monocytogenes]|nr:hypothetical protein [Listeria monocytogenes]EIP2458354.1 IS3 family transposase [Listeria monocytogenes]EIP2514711.1 IS3 family transposase [Listeria monocytogenes]EIR6790359.1 IS3 family transposase [Listeria monocytogenes]EIR6803604.1 IS3 family transposase [Listeria monocytogenes]